MLLDTNDGMTHIHGMDGIATVTIGKLLTIWSKLLPRLSI